MRALVYILISIFLCSIIVYCGDDYYKLLGVPRNANEQQIKRAFKKLALKYHPDKNKDNKEHAQKMFQKIANAYETLMDKEKREVYDRRGEDGVRDFEQQKGQPGGGGMNFNFDDIFSQFFGGGRQGGGGQQFHFNFGGGGGFQQQREPEIEKFFEQSDVIEINLSTLTRFFRRTEVWMIFFYKPQDQDSKKLKDVWRELAEKYYGIFRVAAVNCHTDEELCQDEFSVYEYPSILCFEAKINSEGKKYPKNKQMTLDKLAGFAVSYMENFVNFITTNSYDDFVSREFEKNKLLLFTAKKSTPPLFKALSKDLKGKLVFGEVRKDEKDLINKFQITKFPTMMILTDPANYKGEVYVGDYKKDQMMKFLREYAYTSSRVRKTKEKAGEIQYLDQSLAKRFCNQNDPNFCLIMILKQDQKWEKNLQILGAIAKQYSSDPIGFYYVDSENINYTNVFPTVSKLPFIIAMKGKRNKYSLFDGEINSQDQQNLKIFVDSILGGSQLAHKIHGNLENNLNVKVEL